MSSLYLDSDLADAPSFEDCANALLEAGIMVSPSELHGALCGLLAGGFAGAAGDALSALEKTLDLPLSGPAAEQAERLYMRAAVQMAGGEEGGGGDGGAEGFEPLLPDDSLELPQRVAAMAGWCRSFLGGYAQSRVSAQSADSPVAADSAEALRDFAAIAQAAAEDPDEDGEGEYAELVEYLRIAALNVMADSAAALRENAPGDRGRSH